MMVKDRPCERDRQHNLLDTQARAKAPSCTLVSTNVQKVRNIKFLFLQDFDMCILYI